MLTFDVQLTGGQVGSRLCDDAEECRYALEALAEDGGEDLIEELAEFGFDNPGLMIVFLRDLANAIEGSK